MKQLIFADNHFCQYSSIIRSREYRYSKRLENQIKSLNWVNSLAINQKVDEIICLGDFFDSSSLNAEELTALQDIKWANLPIKFLVGNHEMWKNDLSCSSSHLFNLISNAQVIDIPCEIDGIGYLPYILEIERQPLSSYFDDSKIIFSHNDIKGINYNTFVSQSGFSIDEIKDNCKLFVNGHLHNGQVIETGIINLGNLTGQNFSEDASKYFHCVMILDTDTLKYELIENPYAFNFYKITFPTKLKLKNNAVCTVKCKESEIELAKEWLKNDCIVESRLIVDYDSESLRVDSDDLHVDHIQKFVDFVHDNIGVGDIIDSELAEVTK